MKTILVLLVLVFLSGCAASRVLVKDCKDAGPDLLNCEKVKDL